jgi:hypothetical protein
MLGYYRMSVDFIDEEEIFDVCTPFQIDPIENEHTDVLQPTFA